MEHPRTAVDEWMEKQGVDVLRLAVELRHVGVEYEPSYLKQVVDGYYPPSRKLQNALHLVTGVSIDAIATYPYRSKRASTKHAA